MPDLVVAIDGVEAARFPDVEFSAQHELSGPHLMDIGRYWRVDLRVRNRELL